MATPMAEPGSAPLDDGIAATREPILGSLTSFLGVGFILAAPMWVIALAVVHTEIVRQAAARVVMGEGIAINQAGEVISGPQIYWELLTSPWLLLASLTVSTVIVGCVMFLLALGVGVWHLSSLVLGPVRQRRAHERYGAMVDGPIELTSDAWAHNLPIPDEPVTHADPDLLFPALVDGPEMKELAEQSPEE